MASSSPAPSTPAGVPVSDHPGGPPAEPSGSGSAPPPSSVDEPPVSSQKLRPMAFPGTPWSEQGSEHEGYGRSLPDRGRDHYRRNEEDQIPDSLGLYSEAMTAKFRRDDEGPASDGIQTAVRSSSEEADDDGLDPMFPEVEHQRASSRGDMRRKAADDALEPTLVDRDEVSPGGDATPDSAVEDYPSASPESGDATLARRPDSDNPKR